MSSESSRVKSESRNRPDTGVRRLAARKATLRRLSLDALEPRTLMAVLPAPVFSTTNGTPVLPTYQTYGASVVSTGGGAHSDDSSPSIAIDPLDPNKMVSVWTHNDPFFAPGRTEFVQYGVSTDGGKTWRNEGQPGPSFLFDPRTSGTGLQQFSQGTDASVAFDRGNNFYVLWSEHTASNDSGAIRLEKFDFSGTTPTVASTFSGGPTTVYEWVTDQAVNPVLAVDSSVPTFSDTTADNTVETQNDPYTDNVYVSWQTVDQAPPNAGNFNPNRIAVTASSDGGVSFSGEQYLNSGGNSGNQRNVTPQLAISQGSAARPAGTNGANDPGSPGVSPGQVTGVWDDYGTASAIGRDRIVTNSITNGAFSQTFPSPTGAPKFVGISSGIVFAKGDPVTPQTTDVPIDVNVTDPRFVSLSHLTANLIVSLVGTAPKNANGNLAGLEVQLVPPSGSGLPTVTLLRNQLDPAGNNTGGGAAGTGLGFLNFNNIGTTFDDKAARNIVNGATPLVGHFRPELGSLDGSYGGAVAGPANSPNSINGQWTLHFTNFLADNTAVLEGDGLDFTSGFTPGTRTTTIAQTPVRARQSGAATVAPADSQGIAPVPVIASDNTLGAFSPNQGRLYVAYVGRPNLNGVPADNTDIHLVTSDDGGTTWYDPSQPANGGQNQGSTDFGVVVHDDQAQADGYSEGANVASPAAAATVSTNPNIVNSVDNFNTNGRPQFMPSVAVDPTNGTLALSWYDARNDASRARVATYLTTSIDGGGTFSPDAYANDSQIATDAITGAVVNLGPIPANENAPSSVGFDTFLQGYGSHQGLAIYGGQAHPVWADNQNGGTDNKQTTSIYTNTAYYATGPRVVAVTSGPVGQVGDTLNTDTQADGTPVASTFLVTFDRPIDPSTFTAADAVVQYRDTTPNGLTSGPRPVTSVVPVAASVNQFGATQFLVNFGGGNGVGTYSLEITSADISDRIRTITSATAPVGPPLTVTASTDAPNGSVPATATTGSPAVVLIPVNALPTGEVLRDVSVTVNVTAAQDNQVRLTLIAPGGTRIPLVNPSSGTPGSGGFVGTTFSSSDPNAIPLTQGNPNNNYASPPTYVPFSSLAQLDGKTIGANQSWGLEVRVLGASGQSATINDFSVTYQPASSSQTNGTGNMLDQNVKAYLNTLPGTTNLGDRTDFFASPTPINPLPNPVLDRYGANVGQSPLPSTTPFSGPYDPNTLPLIVPGPHVVSSQVTGQPSAPGNLVVNGEVSSIDVTFDRDIDPLTFTAASVLRVLGPAGQIPGPFTVSRPLDARTFRISFPTPLTVSGTYSVTLASNIADANGNQLDTNLNAGLNLLRGTTGGATTTVNYNAPATFQPSPFSRPVPNVPLPLADGKTSVSTLVVPANFLASDVSVQLDITDANDPDLQITLVAPNGASVLLVPRGTGKAGSHANFTGTVFADPGNPNFQPTTPITNGAPPFNSAYFPAQALSALNGTQAQGAWKLVIDDASAKGTDPAGTLNSWSLKFQQAVQNSGLGEQVADQASVSFRIFTADGTNPQSSDTWTAVGPAPLVNAGSTPGTASGFAGQVSAVVVDTSDPSGNTVFASGASGGVWKTTDFLTTDPQGPNWTPLTDFGPNSGINIGSIAVFPRNNDPRQSIVIAGTGDPSTGDAGHPNGPTSAGVGFIISTDGGASWKLLDSTNNNLSFAQRDHTFAQSGASGFGTSTVKLVADPRLSPSGQVIFYAALKGAQGGLWTSTDTGQTWTRLSAAGLGAATDVTLDYASATVNTLTNPTGNVNTLYAAFPGSGVYLSPNRGVTLNLLSGGATNPLFHDVENGAIGVPVNNGATAPVGQAGGRIFLAKPALVPSTNPNADVENVQYERWLYAAVVGGGALNGVYLTKDNGQTWTKLQITGLPSNLLPKQAVPTNDSTQPQYDVTNSSAFTHGDYDSSFAIDPTNPNITYLGGTANGNDSGFIRIDATTVEDSHALVPISNSKNDGGLSSFNSTGAVSISNKNFSLPYFYGTTDSLAFGRSPYLNLTIDPNNAFATNSTILTYNVAAFTNDGYGVKWTPIDALLSAGPNSQVPSSNVHSIVTFVDPLTGNTRLLVGDDQGVFSGELTATGTLTAGIGTAPLPAYSRNGNLQLAQVNYGAAQPSLGLSTGGTAPGLFYGNSDNLGQFNTDPNVLSNGNTAGQGSTDGAPAGVFSRSSADQLGVGVAVDQQGKNVVYRYLDPAYGGNGSDFLQVSTDGGRSFVSRTIGLVQVPNDPQWPGQSPRYGGAASVTVVTPPAGTPPVPAASNIGTGAIPFGNLTVNPLDSDQAIISSNVGRIFETTNQGMFWTSIGEPGALDGSYAPALTFGAPGTSGSGNLNSLLYAGTVNGNIFVNTGGNWTFVSSGLDGSPVVKIIADPNRGTRDAYAVTQQGVYYNPDTTATGALWRNITGNLFTIASNPFGVSNFNTAGAPINAAEPLLSYLTTIQADWRYVIPNAATTGTVTPTGPTTHPVLYVGGDGGVFRSLDNGATWSQFPSMAVDAAPFDGGYLPVVQVTDLSTSLGKINPSSGLPQAAPGDPNALLASTYGRGQFSIRLAPLVLPGTVALDTKLPAPNGSVSGKDAKGNPLVKTSQPVIDGFSEVSGLGNTVRISIIDLTDPSHPVIGGFDPSQGPIGNNPTDVAANHTDTSGHFSVQVNPNGFGSNGLKTIGIQATDPSGTQGNIATLTFTLQARLTANTAPAVPTLSLSTGQDSSLGFNFTNVNRPFVGGTTDPGVPVQVFIVSTNGVPDGQLFPAVTSDANGNYKVQFPSTLPDATYVLQAVAYNPTNNTLHSKSANYTFTVDTVAPTSAPSFYLEDANKAPVPSRNVTTTNRAPVFVGSTVPFGNVRLYSSNGTTTTGAVLNSVRADSNGRYEIRLANALGNGTISLQVRATDAANNPAPAPSPVLTLSVVTVPADYTGAGKTTPTLFRRNPNGTVSFVIQGATGSAGQVFPGGSASQDIPLVGDFDGDGINDKALYRPGAGAFFIARTRFGGETLSLSKYNTPGSLPVVGDFDGGGVSEVGLYDPATGVWTLNESTRGVRQVKFNSKVFAPRPGDVPVPGNYDGTGTSELAVYRPATGQFFIQAPGTSGGFDNIRVLGSLDPDHNPGDLPVPGNYDDTVSQHVTEAAVFNPATGAWYIQGHNPNAPDKFNPGDIPAPGDYDGLGRTEEAVYRPAIAAFAVNGPSGIVKIGAAGDIPVTAPLAYRNLPAGPPTVALFNAISPGGSVTSARHPIFGGQTTTGAVVNLLDANGKVVNSAQADGNGNYAVGDPATLANGTYSYTVRAVNLVGGIGAPSQPQLIQLVTVQGDYTGAGVTQPALFLRGPSNALTFYVQNDKALNGKPFFTRQGDVPIVADFLGTGTDQVAIFTPSRGDWTIAQAGTGYAPQLYLHAFGASTTNTFIPAPADYKGNGVDQAAVYQTTTGRWYIQGQASAVAPITSPRAGDLPVPGNYDNFGKVELALYRPSTQTWYINGPFGVHQIAFGGAGDVPVPGNYFATAASPTATEAVWRPTVGEYLIRTPAGGTVTDVFRKGDIPAPGDYDGIGRTEAAVYRPSTGQFLVMGPADRTPRALNPSTQPFGNASFLPLDAPYPYRAVPVKPAVRVATPAVRHTAVVNLAATAQTFATPTAPRSLTPPPASAPRSAGAVRARPNQSSPAAPTLGMLKGLVATRKGV